jgi:DNA-binding MurR/RpiR family transcriptional regulator
MEYVNEMAASGNCLNRIKQFEDEFTETSKKISVKILQTPDSIIHMTIVQTAELCGTSEASIVRFCKMLGYEGFNDFKINLAGELSIVNEPILPALQAGDDDITVLHKVFAAEIKAMQDTSSALDAETFKRAVESVFHANKVEFYACGNSNAIAQDAHYRLLKIGMNSYLSVNAEDFIMRSNMMAPGDVSIAISHTGSTKYTCMAQEAAYRRGAGTICITAFPKSLITRFSNMCLFAVMGNTADFQTTTTASRTAELAILDALYTAVAFRKGESAKQYIRFTDRILDSGRY